MIERQLQVFSGIKCGPNLCHEYTSLSSSHLVCVVEDESSKGSGQRQRQEIKRENRG